MFDVGDAISYPMYGAGFVDAIEEREILGETKHYFVLRFLASGTKVMVPVENALEGSLRATVSNEQARSVLDFMASKQDEDSDNWNRRYRENLEKMRTGDIMDTAQVVCRLMVRNRQKRLSGGELKMLNAARKVLTSELSVVLEMSEEALLDEIEQTV